MEAPAILLPGRGAALVALASPASPAAATTTTTTASTAAHPSERRSLLKRAAAAATQLQQPPSVLDPLLASAQLALEYVVASLRRDRRAWGMGIATVTLVVCFAALLESGIETSPVIFLKLSEDQSGEADVLLTPAVSADNGLPFMNWTAVDAAIRTSPSTSGSIVGTAPRWALLATAANRFQPSRSSSCVVLAIDSAQEASIGLGRAWDRRPLGEGEAYVASSLLDGVGVQGGVGQRVLLTFSLARILATASAAASGSGGASSVGGAGSSSSNGTVSESDAAVAGALLLAAGIDPTSLSVTVDGLTALEIAIQAAGLSPAINISSLAVLLPGLSLYTVDLGPVVLAALASAVGAASVTQPYTVVDALATPGGKYPSLLGNVAVIEAAYFALLVQETAAGLVARLQGSLGPIVAVTGPGTPLAAALATLQALPGNITYAAMQAYAMQTAVMASSRLDIYLHGGPDAMDASLAGLSDGIMMALGPGFPASASTPLGDVLDGIKLIVLFLSQVFYVTIFILAALGAMVIYALVLGDVETRTYETGMLRALGLRHATLAQLLGLQTLAFALPGVALGLAAASLLNLGVAFEMGGYAALTLPLAMPPGAWAFGTGLGVLVPALATVVPVRRALSSSLRDALDLYHSSLSEVSVRVTRLVEMGLSPPQLALALVMVGAGFTTFYLLPLSFLFSNLAFFLGLLTAVLMAMLCGLALVALVAQPLVERLLLALLLSVGPDARLHTVVSKNVAGHRPRNIKTAAMIGVSVAFLVFASAMFGLQGASISTNVRLLLGADIVALVPATLAVPVQLPQADMTAFLQAEQAASDVVAGFSFVSLPLTTIPFIRRSQLSNLVALPRYNTMLYGVQRNFLEVAYGAFASVTEASTSGLSASEAAAAATANGWAAPGGGWASSGGVSDYVYAHPVDALYEGAGRARVPVESTLSAPPLPLATGELDAPLFVCNASVAAVDLAGPWVVVADVVGWNDTSLGSAYAGYRACGGAIGCTAPAGISSAAAAAAAGQSLAFTDYDYCVVACADPSVYSAGGGGGRGGNVSVAQGAAAEVTQCFGGGGGMPYYGPQILPGGGLAGYLGSGPSPVCSGFAAPCIATSSFDLAAQQDRVDTAYLAYVDILMSEALRGAASLSTQTPLQIRLITRDPSTGYSLGRVYMAKARAMARKIPAFFFSSYSTTASRSPVLVRMQDYARLYGDATTDYASILAWEGSGGSSSSSSSAANSSSAEAEPTPAPAPAGFPPLPATLSFVNSSGAWLLGTPVPALALAPGLAANLTGSNALLNVTTAGGGGGAAGGPGVWGPVSSFLFDNDAASLLVTWTASAADLASAPAGSLARRLNATGVAVVSLNLGGCALVTGVRLLPLLMGAAARGPSPASQGCTPSALSLYALSDAAAGAFQLVASAMSPATAPGNEGSAQYSFTGFSAQYWALVFSPANVTAAGSPGAPAPASSLLAVPDLQLQLSSVPPGACQATALAADDAAIGVPKGRLLVRLKDGATDAERTRVLNGIRSTILSDSIIVQDVTSLLASANTAIVGLNIFFNFVAALCLILCFFASWLSFSANVQENSVELGIMRSLGLSVAAVTRVFMYEALVVVLSAFLLGTLIGFAVAVSLTLQFGLFTEMPFQMEAPTELLVFTLLACIALALASSWEPTRQLARLKIAAVLKGRTG